MDIKNLTYLTNFFLTSSHLSARSWLNKIWPAYYIFSISVSHQSEQNSTPLDSDNIIWLSNIIFFLQTVQRKKITSLIHILKKHITTLHSVVLLLSLFLPHNISSIKFQCHKFCLWSTLQVQSFCNYLPHLTRNTQRNVTSLIEFQ